MKPSFTSRPLLRGLNAPRPIRNPTARPRRAFSSQCASKSPSPAPSQRTPLSATSPRFNAPAGVPGLKHSACGCACACSSGIGSEKPRKKAAYIALGSNLGDRVAEIERACNEMDRRGIKVKRTSSLWETKPMYVEDQARFLNGACEVSDDGRQHGQCLTNDSG